MSCYFSVMISLQTFNKYVNYNMNNKHACHFQHVWINMWSLRIWSLPCYSERLGERSVQESLNADMLKREKLVEKFWRKRCAACFTHLPSTLRLLMSSDFRAEMRSLVARYLRAKKCHKTNQHQRVYVRYYNYSQSVYIHLKQIYISITRISGVCNK